MSVQVIIPAVMTIAAAYSGMKAIEAAFEGDWMEAVVYGVGAYAGFSGAMSFGSEAALGSTAAAEVGTLGADLGANLGSNAGSFLGGASPEAMQILGTSGIEAAAPDLLSTLGGTGLKLGEVGAQLGAASTIAPTVGAAVPQVAQAAAKAPNFLEKAMGVGKQLVDKGLNMVEDVATGDIFDSRTGQLLQQGQGVMSLAKPLIGAWAQDKAYDKQVEREDELMARQEAKEAEERRLRQTRSYG